MHPTKFDKDFFLNVISAWKATWMQQTQNDPEDFENYRRRAFGIDANMKHSLASMLAKAVACDQCNGAGMIGGFVSIESGYDGEPCPSCAQPEITETGKVAYEEDSGK